MTTAPVRSRIHGFDVIRLISFFVVSYYHFTYAVFHGHEDTFYSVTVRDPVFNWTMHPFERALAFSGHTLLFLSMMLVALAGKSFKTVLRFSTFLIVAWLLFTWSENDFKGLVAAWDIHPLIFVGLITMVGAQALDRRLVPVLAVIGFFMTLIQFYTWPSLQNLNLYARSILIGDCNYEVSSWPILPWLGFLYFGYGVGFALRSPNVRAYFGRMTRVEMGVWSALCLAALFNVGTFYRIPMEAWECQAFRQSPIHFYSDFIFVLLAIRLSLLVKVDVYLQRKVPWVVKLNVSRNFFLAYALQYAFAFLVAAFYADAARRHTQLYMWIGILMLPAAEIVAALAEKAGARRLFKGSS